MKKKKKKKIETNEEKLEKFNKAIKEMTDAILDYLTPAIEKATKNIKEIGADKLKLITNEGEEID